MKKSPPRQESCQHDAVKSPFPAIDSPEADAIADMAKMLELHVLSQPMSVILVPAPEPQHENHMIRVVASRPPAWYLEIAARWGYKRKRQGRFLRGRFLRALKRIQEKRFMETSYTLAALAACEQAISDPEEIFSR